MPKVKGSARPIKNQRLGTNFALSLRACWSVRLAAAVNVGVRSQRRDRGSLNLASTVPRAPDASASRPERPEGTARAIAQHPGLRKLVARSNDCLQPTPIEIPALGKGLLGGMRTRSCGRGRAPATGSVRGPSRGRGATGETRRKWPFPGPSGNALHRHHRAAVGAGGRPEMNFTRYDFQTAA